ncbi:cell division protein FtsQ/DivIB [Candidatus Marithioploca araucensis]|uniref:Cell division protein FtsQ n=1 Tax=Candidatus Marithioploca araucensis TaxID=70273 RepID=A0ABT7VQI8_9GAMM|nr:cell division protein FtsQ/DivIB [Candidatus Marithioploca araucensis]
MILEPHTLPMTTVRIEGHLINTDPQVLQTIVSQVAKGGFFSIDMTTVRLAVLKFPWIKDVQIHRQWPNTLLIQVQERQVIAQWQNKALVDDEGYLFNVPLKRKGDLGLPQFYGPPNSVGKILERYNQLAPLVNAYGFSIHEFGYNARQTWYMVLDNGIKLRLSRYDKKNTRLQRFIKVYHRLLSTQKLPPVYVDLRYTNGIAVLHALAD